MTRRAPSAGLTLVELVVATGLVTLLVVALVRLVDTSLTVWDGTETRRDVLEHATAALELLADDLRAVDGGPRGDFLVDWAAHDPDRDGLAGLFLPRMRLVRRMSAAELARAGLAPAGADARPLAGALLEVAWTLVPAAAEAVGGRAPDRAAPVARLLRGERVLPPGAARSRGGAPDSFFAPGFLDARGRAPEGAVTEVSSSVLWLGVELASQASDLTGAWTTGDGVEDCSTAWDAWYAGGGTIRLDADLTVLNRPAAGSPPARELPVLPRRVRVEIEVERERDRIRRTVLAAPVGPGERTLAVRDPSRLPRPGGHVLVDEEWMEVVGVRGSEVDVVRGTRGSRNTEHGPGARVHFGQRVVRQVRVDAYREDWNL